MAKISVEVGIRIRKRRKENGFSQENFAHHCKLDRSYMGRIERGEVNITLEVLYQLADALECHPKHLLP